MEKTPLQIKDREIGELVREIHAIGKRIHEFEARQKPLLEELRLLNIERKLLKLEELK
jgi:hypothetical protein